MKRIYVAGPMTGYPELNFPAFHGAAAALRAEGHHVENPAEINADPTAQWLDCMRADIPRLVTCDAVFLLPGWERSRGARIEQALAAGLGLQVLYSEGAAEYWPEGVPVAAWANQDTALVTLADAAVAIQKMAIEAPATGGTAQAVQCVYLVETGEFRNGADLVERHEQMPRAGSDFEVVYKQPESCNSTAAAPAAQSEDGRRWELPASKATRRRMVQCRQRSPEDPPIVVHGWALACGAVLHRSILGGKKFGRFCQYQWTVTDQVTGLAIARGEGMAGAIKAYRERVRSYGDSWGAVLAEKRNEHAVAQRAPSLKGGGV